MTDEKNKEIQDKFDQTFVKRLGKGKLSGDFHNRFWDRFEKEKRK